MASNEHVRHRKIGELADAAGLTVRTLHYYEEIGLLAPSERTDAGHRLYADTDVERLYRISLLRSLGLTLGDIARTLDDPSWHLEGSLRAHLDGLERRLDTEARLRTRLRQLLSSLTSSDGDGDEHTTEELLTILEDMTMLDTAVQRRISILVYADLDDAHEYLTRVFALGPGEITRDDDGNAVHAELHAGDGLIWLHPEAPDYGLASPRTLGSATASVAVMVDDVDEHHRHAVANGAEIVYPPVDQPYGYREYSARDNEGALWSFMKPLD